jgi:hypothetical protein
MLIALIIIVVVVNVAVVVIIPLVGGHHRNFISGRVVLPLHHNKCTLLSCETISCSFWTKIGT